MTPDAFWANVTTAGDCWPYVGRLLPNGYSRVWISGRYWYGHQFAFYMANGWIPELPVALDHLCGNRQCVNPSHLDAVRQAVNVRRGKSRGNAEYEAGRECLHGHAVASDQWVLDGPHRRCPICYRMKNQAAWQRRKTRLAAQRSQ